MLDAGREFGDLVLGGRVQPSDSNGDDDNTYIEKAKTKTLPNIEEKSQTEQQPANSDIGPVCEGELSDEGQGQVDTKGQMRSELQEKSLAEVTARKSVFFRRPGLTVNESFFQIAVENKKSG